MEVGSEAWAFTPVWLPDVPKFAMPATTVHIGVSNVPMNVEAGDSRNSLLESEHVIDVDCRREGTAGIKYLARRRWNYANVVRQFCIRWEYNGEWNYRHPVNPDPQFVSGRGTKISNLYQDKIVVDVAVRWWIGRHPTKVIKVRKDERYFLYADIRAQLATFRPLNGINTPFQLVALPQANSNESDCSSCQSRSESGERDIGYFYITYRLAEPLVFFIVGVACAVCGVFTYENSKIVSVSMVTIGIGGLWGAIILWGSGVI